VTELETLHARLQELHRQTADTPLFNPVFQVGLELSRRIESGALSLASVTALVDELECQGLQARASRLTRLLAPVASADNAARLRAMADQAGDFASFAARWQHPLAHVVFTAHPTFLLSAAQSAAVAASAASGAIGADTTCTAPAARDSITLDSEHAAAMTAIARAQAGRDQINAALFDSARARWPGQWRALHPLPLRFASWVGYDMDGRTDISWATSLRYRLAEKAERLTSYVAALAVQAPAIAERLQRAAVFAEGMAERFAKDLSDPAALSETANALTADHPDKLTSLTAVIAELEALARPPTMPLRNPCWSWSQPCAPTGWGWAGSTSG